MITDKDIEYNKNHTDLPAVALAWVIDTEVVYAIAVTNEIANLFMKSEYIDVSDQYPDYNGISVKLIGPQGEEIFQTSEYFGSIILSNPVIINLLSHKYGKYILGSGEFFINNEFVIPSSDTSSLDEWSMGYEPDTGRPQALCASYCQCSKLL